MENIEQDPAQVQDTETSVESHNLDSFGVVKNFDEDLLAGLRVDPQYDEPILHQVLRIAVYDEYHAYETYKKAIETFGAVEPFNNILQAEVNHCEALIPLLNKYRVPVPVNDWEGKIESPDSILEASEIGVAAEIDNIKMYDNLIGYAQGYPDILDILYRLQAASYNNHLPAFRQSVAKHTNLPVDINSIYQQYSTHETAMEQEDITAKMNDFNQMAAKLAKGELAQEDILKFLGNTNLSFIGGTLIGAVGTMIFSQMTKNSETQQEEELCQ